MHFLVVFNALLFLVKVHNANAAYLSYKKVTTSKSLYSQQYPTKATTDGDDYSRMDMQSSSCFQSQNGLEQWIKIDLEKEYNVTKVTIINRVEPDNAWYDRLAGAEVRIGNNYTAMVNEKKCGMSVSNEQVETSAIVDVTCDEPISGRYLILWHPVRSASLDVCEIRVYNEEPEISECSLDTQFYSDYRGLVSITENGHMCQAWTSQSPHSHSFPIDAEKGTGDHNLCRNPSRSVFRPWCHTTDPNIRWEYCDVAKAGTSCPLATHTSVIDMGAVKIFELGSNSLTSWFTSKDILAMTMISADYKNHTDILQPVNTLVSVASNSFHKEVNALTLTMYIYPNGNSSGEILSAGSGDTRLRIEQTYSNGLLYHSEVTVFYGDQKLTRAHVLLPEAWTLLAITFDGTSKTIKLWRNGDIASIGFTDFNSFDMSLDELQVGSSNGDLFAKIAFLQVYDRVLNEAEMKVIRDIAFVDTWVFDGQAKFTKLKSSFRLTGSQLYEGTESLMVCSRKCLQHVCCKAFRFSQGSNSTCTLLSTFAIIDSLPEVSDVEYYQKAYHSYLSLKQC